ncbi:MAG TPA: DUF4011 domain-containing protein, partial [Polyangiaceae bacterium]|nr:DUF4011 domain-containing protein [Polyangiaceae bacterium]
MTATNSPVQRIADGTAAVQETIAPEVQIEVTTAESICFAMECAAIPIVMDLKITNLSTGAFLSVEVGVTLQPGLGAEQRVPIASLQPGGTVSLPVLDFRLDPGWLRSVVEREPSELVIRVLSHGRELSRVERRVEVLAYNEWPGLRAPASLLASFVMPNEPCIALLLGVVGDILLRTTRDPAIVAYQSKSLGRARAEVAALYDCVSQFGLRYVGVPPSFEDAGQKVRLVETVLSNKLANCLDVALLFASALEAMNFAPLVILLDTHAFCGVWLEDDRFSEGEVEDSARLRTLAQLGSLLLFDGTAALSGRTFADAQALATHHLSSEERFRTALDIRVLRRARYLPLPIRRDRHLDAVARYPVNPVLPNRDDPQHSREQAEPLRAAPETVTQSRFRKWKESLLDLTLRNRLLNFRLTGKSVLRLDVPDVELFEDLLAADRPLQMLSRPAESALRSPELLLRRDADAAEVRKALREDLSKALIYSAEPETELWERAITLDRAARKDLEEGGAATLFVAIGLLRWYESSSSEEARLAPLLLYPVKLEFDRRSRRLTLRREADDPVVNQTLIEKMRLDFKVDLSALARLEADEPGVNVDSLLRCARQAVQQVPRWEVLSEAHIALFSFAKFLMWKDLDENAEQLLKSAVVKRIAEGTCVEGAVTAETVDLRSLDANVSPAELPCVLDLDGTQLAAVATALDGASFVLQGPPGTGKSQTITTLIAAALARGKTVLFVSEKMAALDVVHRRLRNVGLSDFCLELHSHKTNKKDVIASFNAVLERQRGPQDNGKWKDACEELTGLRAELNGDVQGLHQPTLLGASYYEVGSRLHELSGNPDVHVQSSTVRECSGQPFRALLQAVERFSGTAARVEPIAEHPWRASGRVKLEAAEERSLALLVTGAIAALRQLEDASQRIALHLGRVLTGCWEEVHGLCSAADALIQDLRLLDREWSSGPIAHAVHNAPAWSGLVDQANGYLACRGAIEHGASQLSNRWLDTFCEQDIERLATVFQQRSRSMFSWFYLRGARRSLLPSARGDLPGNAQITEDLLLAHHLT